MRLAANRERAKIGREEKRRRLNPEEVQVAKNLNAKKAREDRQAEAPDERALRQRFYAEWKRVTCANETQVEHEARLLDQRIRQQLLRQEQAEEENRARLLAEAERQSVFRQEEENRARLLAVVERQADLRQDEEIRARLQAEAERQARKLLFVNKKQQLFYER